MTERNGGLHLESDAGVSPSEDERVLEELRSLLMGKNQRELLELRERLDNLKIRTQDVSEVVAEALRLRELSDKNHELSHILAPAVEQALRESVRKDAAVLAEALYPVMGPAIRKSIYEAIRALIQSFNEALAQGLSLRGLKWRLEAIRTGRPFAEVVMLHTLVFRVEQVFLIHKSTGLLLHHLATPQLGIQDPDMVSSMLSAIRAFIRDSFNAAHGASVNTMQVEDLEVWIEQGPHAILAAVIRGHAPQRIRFKLKERLEQIHQRFSEQLVTFEGDASAFLPAMDILGDTLESQLGQESSFRPRPFVTVLASIVLIAGLAWGSFSVYQSRKWNLFVENLRHEPGIVVTSFEKRDGRYHIEGLRDAFASDPAELATHAGLDLNRVALDWRAYISAEDPMVQKRAIAILKPPQGVSVSVKNGKLILVGESDSGWASRAQNLAPLIPGLRTVDFTRLSALGPLGKEEAALESKTVLFASAHEEIPDSQAAAVQEVARALRGLLTKSHDIDLPVMVEVIGHTDSTGTEGTNSLLSRHRAQNVERALAKLGISVESLRLRGVANTEPIRQEQTDADRQFNRSVTFRVSFQDSAGKP